MVEKGFNKGVVMVMGAVLTIGLLGAGYVAWTLNEKLVAAIALKDKTEEQVKEKEALLRKKITEEKELKEAQEKKAAEEKENQDAKEKAAAEAEQWLDEQIKLNPKMVAARKQKLAVEANYMKLIQPLIEKQKELHKEESSKEHEDKKEAVGHEQAKGHEKDEHAAKPGASKEKDHGDKKEAVGHEKAKGHEKDEHATKPGASKEKDHGDKKAAVGHEKAKGHEKDEHSTQSESPQTGTVALPKSVDINAEKKIALEAEKEKNYAKSLSVWLTLSNAGDGQASYRAAFHYLNGWGLPIDINAATKAFEKSIEQGYGLAKYSYAKVVISGYHGIKKDPKKGLEMLKSAIASKDKSAFQAFERELKNKTVEPPAFLMEAARELYKEKAWETKDEALLEKLGIKR